ncbi:hypothetical protein JW752_01380 [Candidatus Peregrinibacteria bacterium]|nr:hypothetical protein [Candidatus Peregrinibacteria bacterium]
MEPANPTTPKETPDAAPKKSLSNIFSTPLGTKRMDKATELKKKNQIKGYIQLGISVVALGLYSFFFLYDQVPAYLDFSNTYAALQEDIEDKEVTIANLEEERDAHKAAYDATFREEQAIISTVLPEETDKLGVIRLMENFATHLNTVYPPFEFTSITFREPVKEDGYTVLPFSTSIHASTTNFDRFLGLINLSGGISPESPDHIRLMEISNVSLNYRGVDKEGKDQGVDFNVELKAYSR